MAKLEIVAGATSQSVNVFIRDSTSTTGGGLAAVAPAGGSLLTGTKLYYSFTGANASAGVAVSLSVLAAVNSAWSSAGIVTLDGTNMIGWVRVDIPDAALASGKGRVVSFLMFGGTNMAPTPFEIELTATNNQDGVHFGLTGIPNAAAGASGGLLISGSNSGTTTLGALTVTGTLTISDGVAVTRSTGNSSAVALTGSGTGHGLLITSGNGVTGDGLKIVAASTNGNGVNSAGIGTGAGMVLTKGASGIDLDADITGNITGNLSGSVGSVTGAVGSVTGAVGSVTGNVGGNVTGSVGSVVGAVGSVTGNVGGNVTGSVGSVVAAVAVGTLNANVITAASIAANAITAAATDTTFDNSIADALLDRSNGIEASITPRQAFRAMASALGGVLAGAATSNVTIKELGGTSFTRIDATVDVDGNRSAIVLSL